MYAQTERITVSGAIVDAQGEFIIGASVLEKETTNGTMTDINGRYSLSVDPSATLEVSYLGYTSLSVSVNGRQTIDMVLSEDARLLGEVVVTALAIKRETRALGYAMTEIKGEDLNINIINPVSALQGRAAGVYIGGSDGGMFGSSKIQIRGVTTLRQNNQPIYVIDGVLLDNSIHHAEVDHETNFRDYGNELKNLNSNDIETVSILKGAAATALYGSRGLNGAVVITTKGSGLRKGLGVSVNQSFGIERVNTLPNFQTEYGHGTLPYAGATRRPNPWSTKDFEIVDGQETILYGGFYWGPRYDGRKVMGYDGELTPYSPHKNFYRDMFDTGFSTNTNVVVSGGDNKTTFYNSLGYQHVKGVVANNEFSRLSR